MAIINASELDLLWLEEILWVLSGAVGVPSYDFNLPQFFACRRPWERPARVTAVGRFGVASNYEQLYTELARDGIDLVHSPEQHALVSELPRWYGLLKGLTPRSLWFTKPPEFALLEAHLGLPLFLKGARQTSQHRAAFSIIRSQTEYNTAVAAFVSDPILHWQEFVAREFIALRPVPSEPSDKIPASFEFRSFWWHGHCVGAAPYWSTSYTWSASEQQAALAVAREAAVRLNVAFVVIDVAQTILGDWLVIECNDAQESGYAAISPFAMWQKIIELEK
jgi:hypothetical protein